MLCMILLIALFFYYYFLKTTKKVFDAQEAWQEKFEDTKSARGKIVRHLAMAMLYLYQRNLRNIIYLIHRVRRKCLKIHTHIFLYE